MMAGKAVDKMTYEELEERRLELISERDDVVGQLKEVTRRRDEVFAEQEAVRVVEEMNDVQRNALAQVLGMQSIPSTASAAGPREVKKG